MSLRTYNFHVDGMHCASCVLLIESELGELPNVKAVKANLKHFSVEVVGDFGDKAETEVAAGLSENLRPRGDSLDIVKSAKEVNWFDFKNAIPIALGFAVLFIALQKMGIVNLVNTSKVSYGTAFIIGIIASLSSCMAVVSGLVLSMSATFAREGDRIKPQSCFILDA